MRRIQSAYTNKGLPYRCSTCDALVFGRAEVHEESFQLAQLMLPHNLPCGCVWNTYKHMSSGALGTAELAAAMLIAINED
jgi:hypothetical protein